MARFVAVELGNGSIISPEPEKYFEWLGSLCWDKKKRDRSIKFKMVDETKQILNQFIIH